MTSPVQRFDSLFMTVAADSAFVDGFIDKEENVASKNYTQSKNRVLKP